MGLPACLLQKIRFYGSDCLTGSQTLMIVDGDREPSDEKIQKFLMDERLHVNAIEDTLLYLASLNDWSLGVDNNSEIFAREHPPVLVQLISYTYKNDLDEESAIRWFDGYVKDFKVNGGFVNGDEPETVCGL